MIKFLNIIITLVKSKLHYVILFLLFSTASSFCQNNHIVKKIFTEDPDHTCISFTNNSSVNVSFSFSLNDNFYSSIDQIKESINALAGPNKDSLFYYAWEFVCKNTYYNFTFINKDWTSTTLLYLNSLGFGLCGRQAVFLAKIWEILGYQTRIVNLNGHIVPEVLYKKRWNMMDPAYKVYYLNKQNQIASVKQLRKKPSLITKPRKIINKNIYSPLRYTKELANIYKTSIPDDFIYSNLITDLFSDFYIFLPPNSTFEFPGNFHLNAKTTSSAKVPYYANCRIKIPPQWKGQISNRLILAEIKGEGVVEINMQKFHTSDSSLKHQINNPDNFIESIYISENPDTLELIYFLNPIIYELKKENKITLTSTDIDKITINSFKISDTLSHIMHLKNEFFFYEEKRIELLSNEILQSKNCINNTKIKTKENLFDTFQHYIDCSSNGNINSISQQITKIKNAFNRLPKNCNQNEIFNAINLLPRELIFYDILQASEESIFKALYYLSKTD